MDLQLVTKYRTKSGVFITFKDYCEVFGKSERVVRQSIYDEAITTKKINKKLCVKISEDA